MKRLFALAVVVFLSSCARSPYIMHHAPGVRLTTQDRIVVYSPDSRLQLALETSMLNRNIFVKTTEIESALSTGLYEETSMEKYGFLNSIARSISKNGKVTGAEKLLQDLKDELVRVEDYTKLLVAREAAMKKVYEVYGVDYILTVSTNNGYGYRARLVSVRDNRLAYAFYLEASNASDFDKLVPTNDNRPNITASGFKPAPQVAANNQNNYVRISEFILDNMLK